MDCVPIEKLRELAEHLENKARITSKKWAKHRGTQGAAIAFAISMATADAYRDAAERVRKVMEEHQ